MSDSDEFSEGVYRTAPIPLINLSEVPPSFLYSPTKRSPLLSARSGISNRLRQSTTSSIVSIFDYSEPGWSQWIKSMSAVDKLNKLSYNYLGIFPSDECLRRKKIYRTNNFDFKDNFVLADLLKKYRAVNQRVYWKMILAQKGEPIKGLAADVKLSKNIAEKLIGWTSEEKTIQEKDNALFPIISPRPPWR